jgi:hypothetical protein
MVHLVRVRKRLKCDLTIALTLHVKTEDRHVDVTTGCGKKTSPISNGSYKQIKKDTEKIL